MDCRRERRDDQVDGPAEDGRLIWTDSLTRAHSLADRLEYGMVVINETPTTWPQTPFGGVKQSGHGRQQGEEAIDTYTETKNVHVRLE